MELNNTVKLMNSTDYKDRFKAEYYQTRIRYDKLNTFIAKIEVSEEYPKKVDRPQFDCPLTLLKEQRALMYQYLQLLIERALIEKIDL